MATGIHDLSCLIAPLRSNMLKRESRFRCVLFYLLVLETHHIQVINSLCVNLVTNLRKCLFDMWCKIRCINTDAYCASADCTLPAHSFSFNCALAYAPHVLPALQHTAAIYDAILPWTRSKKCQQRIGQRSQGYSVRVSNIIKLTRHPAGVLDRTIWFSKHTISLQYNKAVPNITICIKLLLLRRT